MGVLDKIIVQELVKEFSSSRQILECRRKFKIVIILDSNYLSRDAQQALRRTMEKCAKNVRFIFITDSCGRIISPLRSRCLNFRCAAVDKVTFNNILPEGKLQYEFGSLRRSMLISDSGIEQMWWEQEISKLVHGLKDKSKQNYCLEVRKILFQLISNCIPKKDILKKFLLESIKLRGTDNGLLNQIMQIYVLFCVILGFKSY